MGLVRGAAALRLHRHLLQRASLGAGGLSGTRVSPCRSDPWPGARLFAFTV